jgi:SAM-dependent methyltransferase
MPAARGQRTSPTSAGLPASLRAFWIRLYEQTATRDLPWANRGPFSPLVRAVENGWLSPPGPVLDVGCGVGRNAFWLAKRGFRVTGVDIAPGAIAAAESGRESGAQNPRFVVDDLLASALPRAGFRGAVDVGCFHTLPPKTRTAYSASLARLLSPGAPLVLFWVAREETGSWGPPHRLSVDEVTGALERLFVVDRIEYRPRSDRLTSHVKRTARPLATLAGYSARLVRRTSPQPPAR